MKFSISFPFSLRVSRTLSTYSWNLYAHHYRFFVTPGTHVLQMGATQGIFLAELQPACGAVIEHDDQVRGQYQENSSYTIYKNLSELSVQHFDYIIITQADRLIADFSSILEGLKPFCHSRTRLIIESNAGYVNFLPWLWQLMRRKASAELYLQYNCVHDIHSLLNLQNYEGILIKKSIIFTRYVPGLSWFLNTLVPAIPLISALCLKRFIIARPLLPQGKLPLVSIIIPCKNEQGNIERAVTELPLLGSHTEIIFVEGNSHDGTAQEIERVQAQFPDKDIKFFKQTGKGKGNAVRLGFEKAQGDILMILDADLTVEPQELVYFYKALHEGKAEFANGSRLVYPMEKDAMPFLNTLVNYMFGLILSWILGQKIKDTLCGTKALYKKDYQLIAQNRSFFGEFDPFGDFDLLYGAAKLQLNITDIPVHYKSRRYGSSQIGGYFFNGLLLLRMCWLAFKKFTLKL